MSASNDDSQAAPRRLARAEAVLRARTRRFCIVLEDTHDPHNTSAALRTCEAFGVQDVHLVSEVRTGTASLNPKVSIGAHRWLTLHRHYGAEAAIASLRAAGFDILVSHLDPAAQPLASFEPRRRAAYVFGNERTGVSPAFTAAADATFWIPTSGFTGSLNLSVAVAVTVYDRLMRSSTTNPQAAAESAAGDLAPDEAAALRQEWFAALAGDDPARRDEYAAHIERGVEPRAELASDRRGAPVRRASDRA